MCSGSEAGSYLRLKDFVYHSTLGLRVIKRRKGQGLGFGVSSLLREEEKNNYSSPVTRLLSLFLNKTGLSS